MENTRMVKGIFPIRRIGNSAYISIGKQLKKILDVDNETVLGVKLWNINSVDITCPYCKHSFVDYDGVDPYDCPNCGKEILSVNVNNGSEGKKFAKGASGKEVEKKDE